MGIPSYIVESKAKSTAEEAAISAVMQATDIHAPHAQAVQIVIANLIYTAQKEWKAVVSVIREPIRDQDFDSAIIFGHLPAKYSELYKDILPHVDHLNLIDDDTIWKDIKRYLLDIIFYQAVHFQQLDRITETGGGYFKETEKKYDVDPDISLIFNLSEQQALKENASRLFSSSFYKQVQTENIRQYEQAEDWFHHRKPHTGHRDKLLSVLKNS